MSGGARPGAGRKTKVDEEKIANIALDAITKEHGSLEEGFRWLLKTKEPSLIKFVYEHAAGRPKEKIEHSGALEVKKFNILGARGSHK